MSDSLPTVRVVNPNAPDSYMIINVSDRNEEHVLWDEVTAADEALRVTKGPRGKFYAKRGKDPVAGPFETELEAHDYVASR